LKFLQNVLQRYIIIPEFFGNFKSIRSGCFFYRAVKLDSLYNSVQVRHRIMRTREIATSNEIKWRNFIYLTHLNYPTSTRRHGNFAGVHTLLRIILSSNSAVLINIITGVSPPHFDFFVFYVLCQC
jgi:hypothetical protein